MASSVSSLPRAQARLRRLDMRVAVGVLLMLIAVAGGASVLRGAQARVAVIVAAAAVQPGEVIGEEHLRVAEVALPAGISYLPATAREEIVGRVAAEPLWDGKILSTASASEAPPLAPGMVAASLALPAERAACGVLRSGDQVAVVATTDPDLGEAEATILFPSVLVLAVGEADPLAETPGLLVTLRLPLADARALAEAKARGSVELALLGGEAA